MEEGLGPGMAVVGKLSQEEEEGEIFFRAILFILLRQYPRRPI